MYYTVKKKIKVAGEEKTLNILHNGDKVPKNGKEYKGVPGQVNQPIEYYVKGKRKSNDVLTKANLAEDHTGSYFDGNRESQTISKLNEKPRLSWRKEKPKSYEGWNGTSWEFNEHDKTDYEEEQAKKTLLNQLNSEMCENLNFLDSTDHEIFKNYEINGTDNSAIGDLILKRQTARAVVIRLRAEIENI